MAAEDLQLSIHVDLLGLNLADVLFIMSQAYSSLEIYWIPHSIGSVGNCNIAMKFGESMFSS